MGLSWRKVREGFAVQIGIAAPLAVVLDEWPDSFAAGQSVSELRSDSDSQRVHAYLMGSMSSEPSESRVGGGPDHGTLDSILTLRFMGVLGESRNAAVSSADEFEDELKAIRYQVLTQRRTLGISDPNIDELKRVFPIVYEQLYTDDYGDATVHIAEGKFQVHLIERW